MMVVKVGIWPGGDGSEAFEIARLGIHNLSGCQPFSKYGVVALLNRDKEEKVLSSNVACHRRSEGWRPLVVAALYSISHADHAEPHDQRIADRLQKDGRD